MDKSFEKMALEHELLKMYMDNIPDSIYFKDSNHKFVKVNLAKADNCGTTPENMVGKTDFDFLPEQLAREAFSDDEQVIKTGWSIKAKLEKIVHIDGTEAWVFVTKIPWYNKKGEIVGIIGVSRDITDLKLTEENRLFNQRLQDILHGLLAISLRAIPLTEQLEYALKKILSIPWLPFSPKGGIFIIENEPGVLVLKAHRDLHTSLQTICARVPFGQCLCGRAAASQEIVFADCIDERHDNIYEGIIPHGHYCVPILSSGKNLLGVLVLYLQDGHLRLKEEEDYLNAIANALGGIIERKQAAEEIKKSHQIQDVLNSIAHISMQPISLNEQLEHILELILSLPWLVVQSKGSIFLVEDDPDILVMKAQQGLADELLTACAKLPFGKCLCGRAASTREIIFTDCIDHRHEVSYPGISPHGHFCVPIIYNNRILGVLNMYVSEGYVRNKREESFLLSVANTLAGIIERRQAEESLKIMATHDTLTKLYNRTLFFDRGEQALAQAKRYKYMLALLFLDLDDFKCVNDTFGHGIGDLLLKEFAGILRRCIRESDIVARIGGDEFAILLTKIGNTQDAAVVAQKIIDSLATPLVLEGRECLIGVSIGISIYPYDGNDIETLLRNADMAMYRVKIPGKNNYLFYSPETSGT